MGLLSALVAIIMGVAATFVSFWVLMSHRPVVRTSATPKPGTNPLASFGVSASLAFGFGMIGSWTVSKFLGIHDGVMIWSLVAILPSLVAYVAAPEWEVWSADQIVPPQINWAAGIEIRLREAALITAPSVAIGWLVAAAAWLE